MAQKLVEAADEQANLTADRGWEDIPTYQRPSPGDGDQQQTVTHLELARVVERIHRRYADILRVELTRMGVHDVSAQQVMLLFTIGHDELTVRDLLDRGHYLGSNASYNLKQLVDGGYVDRAASPRDRRSARISLTRRGHGLCDTLRGVDESYHRLVTRDEDEVRDLEVCFRTLRRIEHVWTNALRYGET